MIAGAAVAVALLCLAVPLRAEDTSARVANNAANTSKGTTAKVMTATAASVDTAVVGVVNTGTTVITHGFQFDGERPDWPLLLAGEIAARVRTEGGTARVFTFEPDQDPALVPCTEVGLCGTSDATGHAIVAMNWADLSNRFGRGFSEAAGEALAAVLLAESARLDLGRVHLIGHSRGPVVNSEAAERLIAAGAIVEQVTVLDLHDWGAIRSEQGVELVPMRESTGPTDATSLIGSDAGVERGGLDDFDVNELHPEYDCGLSQGGPSGVCAWTDVDYVDSYYQRDGIFDLWGRELQGASNLLFDGLNMGHSEVHCWYRATVSGDQSLALPGAGCDEGAIGGDWFGPSSTCMSSDRTAPLARATDGYNFSAAAAGAASRCPDGAPRQDVLFDWFLAEGIVNGDFEKQSDAGWVSNGGVAGGVLINQSGNNFVRLAAGDERRHAWSHVPADTWALELSFRVEASDPGAELVVSALPYDGLEVVLGRRALATQAGWMPWRLSMPKELRASTLRFGFVIDAGGGAGAEVDIDAVLLIRVPEGLIFADGFESGTASQWGTP